MCRVKKNEQFEGGDVGQQKDAGLKAARETFWFRREI